MAWLSFQVKGTPTSLSYQLFRDKQLIVRSFTPWAFTCIIPTTFLYISLSLSLSLSLSVSLSLSSPIPLSLLLPNAILLLCCYVIVHTDPWRTAKPPSRSSKEHIGSKHRPMENTAHRARRETEERQLWLTSLSSPYHDASGISAQRTKKRSERRDERCVRKEITPHYASHVISV